MNRAAGMAELLEGSSSDLGDGAFDFSALSGSVVELYTPKMRGLLDRWQRHQAWFDARLADGVDPYCKSTTSRISPRCETRLRGGEIYSGVNFASQDYLSLSSHPEIISTAKWAADEYGVHSAGSSALMGNTALSSKLENKLAAFLGYEDCTVFPTGWGAGYGIIKTLVRPDDFVIIDVLAHACLQEGARNATNAVYSVPHLSNDAIEKRLARIRRHNPDAGIAVVTETVFSMDSDTPKLRNLIEICKNYKATLIVDAAHDLGALGPTGRGVLEQQGLVGMPDILMGSFSKTFASNGGFVASNHPALKLALRGNCGPLTFTNAISPVQAAIVMKAIDIIESPEGFIRRTRLMNNILKLRLGLEAQNFHVLGSPSAIVPVILGNSALSRMSTKYALERGAIVNLVEAPAVSLNTCRWRLQVMSDHADDHIESMISISVYARAEAQNFLVGAQTV